MSRCRQEDCEHWNGSACVCAAISGDPDAIAQLQEWMDELDDVDDELGPRPERTAISDWTDQEVPDDD